MLTVDQLLFAYPNMLASHVPITDAEGRLVGNNGDQLIDMGTYHLLNKLSIRLTQQLHEASHLLLAGGGHMVENFTAGPRLFAKLLKDYPDKPLYCLPGSYHFPNRRFHELFPRQRTANVVIFCRDLVSLRHLREEQTLPDYCNVYFDHDMAFHMKDHPLVESNRHTKTKHVLIVERTDLEHPSIGLDIHRIASFRRKLNQLLPLPFKRPLYPLVRYWRSKANTPFRKQCEDIIRVYHTEYRNQPRLVRDISLPREGSIDDFVQAIVGASLVFTQRLHVGIFASILGKQTYLCEGAYHKIRGVYEASLTGQSHVHMMDEI